MNTLKLQKPMMHGPAVMRLQELLDTLGYETDVDGIFGPDTQAAVLEFQFDSGLESDGICGPVTWEDLMLRVDNNEDPPKEYYKNAIVDRRGKHPNPRLYKCKRPWSQIHGVTLHQTGCEMPKNPTGWDRLNAHIGITQEGVAILVNDPTDFIWHAQGLSKNTIGIEIEGNYYGINGDERTLWKGGGWPHHLNEKMLKASRDVYHWLTVEFDKYSQPWTRVCAHRQSARSRIADPGEEIWREIGDPWEQLRDQGTCDTESFCIGTGRPIPEAWDDWYTADYFCKPKDER